MDPLILGSIITGAASIGSSLIGGKSKKAQVLRTPYQTKAEQKLAELMDRPYQDVGAAPVAELSPLQQQALERTQEYADSTPEGFDYLRSLLGDTGDFTENPEIKALLEKVREAGARETNRVGRSLQLRGGATSSPGRDILGRSVADTETNLLAALAPYAEAERGRKVTAANMLAGLGENATLNRLNALSTQGALQRNLEQLRQQAEYERKLKAANYPVETQARLASALLNQNVDWQTTGGEPSIVEQLAPLLGNLAGAYINKPATVTPAAAGGNWADMTDWMNQNAQAWNLY